MDRIRASLGGLLISAGVLHCGNGDGPGSGSSLAMPPQMDDAESGGSEADADPAVGSPDGEQPAPAGGQSGTDAPDQHPAECPTPAPIGADEFQSDVRIDWLLANVLRAFAAEGELLDEPARADLRIVSIGTALRTHGPEYALGRPTGTTCDRVDARVRVNLSTTPVAADGARVSIVDADAGLQLYPGGAELRLPFDYANYSKPERLRERLAQLGLSSATADRFPGVVVVKFDYATEALASHDLTLSELGFSWLGGGDTFGPAAAAPAPLPPECAAAEPTSAVSFASVEEALASAVGNWRVCDGRATSGVEITPDGTWRSIDAEPRRLSGFEHEGVVVFSDWQGNLAGPEASGELSLALRHSEHLWAATGSVLEGYFPLRVSPSGNTLGSGRLVRMSQAVAAAEVPPFADGERAGLDGCSSGEAGLMTFDTAAELSATLVGRWVGCEGFSGELEFDAAGNVTFSPSDSHAAKVEPYVSRIEEGVAVAIGDGGWRVALSTQPLKLWLRPSNLLLEDVRPIVLSAAP